MVHALVDREAVTDFWGDQPFDLRMNSDKSNCDACFLKGEGALVRLFRDEPALADWWIGMEDSAHRKWGHRMTKPEMAQFHNRWTYRELLNRAQNEPELPMLGDDEDLSDECFCTD